MNTGKLCMNKSIFLYIILFRAYKAPYFIDQTTEKNIQKWFDILQKCWEHLLFSICNQRFFINIFFSRIKFKQNWK